MSKTKSFIITLIMSLGLAFFFLKAIWPVLNVSSDGYNTKTGPVIVKTNEDEDDSEDENSDDDDDDLAAVQTLNDDYDDMAEPESDPDTDLIEMAETTIENASHSAMDMMETVKQEAHNTAEESKHMLEDASHSAMNMMETAKTEAIDTAIATVEKVKHSITPVSGGSQVHIITAQGLKYSPLVTKIAVGDSVSWENMSSHDTQAIEGLIPEGAEGWHSSMGENFQRTFTQEGIYIYKCTPHFGAGMGGVIIVGNPVNLDAIKSADVAGAAKRLVKKAIKAAEAA